MPTRRAAPVLDASAVTVSPANGTVEKAASVDVSEVGRTGVRSWSGHVAQELLPELQGPLGVRIWMEMSQNDPVVGAMLFGIGMLIRQASWRVEPASQDAVDQEWAQFVESARLDMSHTWQEFLSDCVSFLPFGWSMHELVWKYRQGDSRDPTRKSQYTDGRIGWRKWPIRGQDTLWRWDLDPNGGVQAMQQRTLDSSLIYTIPIDKALLFRGSQARGNPEGISILRTAYRPWYQKKRIEITQMIGIDRNLAGLPVLKLPDKIDFWTANPATVEARRLAKEIVTSIRADEMAGVVLPPGWDLSLLSSNSTKIMDISPVIERLDRSIAGTILADFLLIGHQQVGSKALVSDRSDLFGLAVTAWADAICDVVNRFAIPRLLALNGAPRGLAYPALKHGDINVPTLEELGSYFGSLVRFGAVTPGPLLDRFLRLSGGAPAQEAEAGEDLPPVESA